MVASAPMMAATMVSDRPMRYGTSSKRLASVFRGSGAAARGPSELCTGSHFPAGGAGIALVPHQVGDFPAPLFAAHDGKEYVQHGLWRGAVERRDRAADFTPGEPQPRRGEGVGDVRLESRLALPEQG